MSVRLIVVEGEFFDGGLRRAGIMPLSHCIGFLLFGDGGRARAASRGGRRAAAVRVVRDRTRARAIIVEVMGSSFFAVMAAAIRLERLSAGAVVRAAVTSAASTITSAVISIAAGVGLVGGTITGTIAVTTAIIVGVAADGMASTASGKTRTLAGTAVAVGRAFLLALVLLELGDFAIPHVVGVVLGKGRTERSGVLLDLVVRLGILLLVCPREGQEHGLGELVRCRAGELGSKDPAVEVGEHGCSTAEACVRRHRHRLLRVPEPSDDPITDVLDSADLFQEKREAVSKVGVRQIIRTFVGVGCVDAVLFEHLHPARGGGDAQNEGKQAKVRRPISSQGRGELRIRRLLVLIVGVGQEELNTFIVEGSDVEVDLLLTSFNRHVEGDLDLVRRPRNKGRIQGHLIPSKRDIGWVPVEDVVGECAMKIGHDSCGTRKRERSRKAGGFTGFTRSAEYR